MTTSQPIPREISRSTSDELDVGLAAQLTERQASAGSDATSQHSEATRRSVLPAAEGALHVESGTQLSLSLSLCASLRQQQQQQQ